ncbi:MAG: glycosyltransferase family 4 protein [Myxococcota bacterium]
MRRNQPKSKPAARTDLLFVTDRMFWRRSIGSEQRIAALIDYAVERGDSVHVAYVGRLSAAEKTSFDRFSAPRLTKESRSLKDTLRATATRSAPRRAFVQSVLRKHRPRIVIVEFLRLIHTVHPRPTPLPDNTRFVIDTHDVLHQRAARYRDAGAEIARDMSAEEEMKALATFDAILAIQEKEGELIKTALPDSPVLVVPHGIDLPEMQALDRAPTPVETHGTRGAGGTEPILPIRLGFLGGRDEANRSALEWFLEHVWPTLQNRFGSRIELHVAGQICQDWQSEATGIRKIGVLETIEDFWPNVDIAVNPVRFGSGLKIKNVEALAYARPLITTAIGAEGLERAGEQGIAIEDEAEAWIRRLSEWIDSPRERARRGTAGREFAAAALSKETAYRELGRWIDQNTADEKHGLYQGRPVENPVAGSDHGRDRILVLCGKSAFTAFVGPISPRMKPIFVFVKPGNDREIRRVLPTCRLVLAKNALRPDINRCILIARRRGIPTLLLVDGPLEWANVHQNPSLKQPGAEAAESIFKPLIHDAVASTSPAQSSWIEEQNRGRGLVYCHYSNHRIRTKLPSDTPIQFDFLLTSARTAAFSPSDHAALAKALDRCAEALRPYAGRVLVRLFDGGLEARIRATLPEACFESGGSFQEALAKSASVISPPSSVVLEAMVHERPTAILHFRPHPLFYEAGFTIEAKTQIEPVLEAMQRRDEDALKRQADSLAKNLSIHDFERDVLDGPELAALVAPRPLDAADREFEHRIRTWEQRPLVRYRRRIRRLFENGRSIFP